MYKKFTESAVVIVDSTAMLGDILNYLYKFNFKKIIFLKKKNLRIRLNLLKKYNFNITIINYQNQEFNYNLIKKKNIYSYLDDTFFLLRSTKFVNFNLFKLHKVFLKNNKKLVITISNKKRKVENTEIFFLKKNMLDIYDFNFTNILKNSNYKLNITDSEFIHIKKKYCKKDINNFFSNIYSRSIILDRDGVINVNKGYVAFKKDFIFQEGAIKAIKYLNNNNYNIFVVSNQSGIARGYFSEEDVKKLHNYLRDELTNNFSFINKIYYSPFHKKGIIKKYTKNSSCRKPGIKLFKILTKEWGIVNKKNLMMIGDQKSDIEFARNAKINSAFFSGGSLYSFVRKLKLDKKF